MSPASPEDRHQIILSKEVMDAIAEWRRKQPDLPNKSQAIRRLIEIALKAEDQDEHTPAKPGRKQGGADR